ncbi:MAG: diaminopimelate decarboxylase [Nanoarchaeales archaeon]|nr:diaminopimelate decarboxylase [Nanoarchaeales archaeon]
MNRKLPFIKEKIEQISKKFPTPFHIYDEKAIIENAQKLKKAFSWNKGFKEYFAVKATPNPHILKTLQGVGFGSDCSSLGELVLCEKVGIVGENIMFTSNNTLPEEFVKAYKLGAIINLDDFTHIEFLEKCVELPDVISFRYNPGDLREGNVLIGKPCDAKFGFIKEQLFEGYKILKDKGIKRFGIHTMVASNELDPKYFIETVKMLLNLVDEISLKIGIKFEFINIGGGIGVPYKPDEQAVDLEFVGSEIEKVFDGRDLKLFMEMGRMITGPYGYLVTKVIHKKHIYKEYIGVDSCMSALMRAGMYGEYHEVIVLGKENNLKNFTYDVVGSLCENNDKFAIDRKLCEIDIGDNLVICDAGAHGLSMGFQYNAKLRPCELYLQKDGDVKLIRRAENLDDYFCTLDFSEF